MDLTSTLAGLAVRRPHVLLVEVPGHGQTRMPTERELRRRGWVESASPADADILFICGTPTRQFQEILDRVWDQLPGPRVRTVATHPAEVSEALDQAKVELLNNQTHYDDARTRSASATSAAPATGDSNSKGRDEGMDQGEVEHGGMSHEGMDHGALQHGDMQHGDMDMPMPGGIGLAEGGSDRDGLDLDVLHVSLGPALRYWPAGLVVRCVLQGDIITDASVDMLGVSPPVSVKDSVKDRVKDSEGPDDGRPASVRYCDQAAGVLALMGWERLARTAFRIRDGLLGSMSADDAARELGKLARRVRRSRVLRWSFRDLPEVLDGVDRLLDDARALLGGVRGTAMEIATTRADDSAGLQRVPNMIVGRDLFAARLIIASLDLATTAAAPVEEPDG